MNIHIFNPHPIPQKNQRLKISPHPTCTLFIEKLKADDHSEFFIQMNIQVRRSHAPRPQLDPKNAAFLFSPSARVRHARRLPSLDDRSLIANPLDSFKQPVFVLDQAVHLAQEVEKLRQEVYPLRQQYELLRTNYDYMNDDADIDPIQEMSRREGYAKVARLQDLCLKLDSELSKMNTAFTDKSRNELNSQVTAQYEQKAELELHNNEVQEAIRIQREKLENLMKSEVKENVIENDGRIKELEVLKQELVDEENKLLEKHQSLLREPPEYTDLTRTLMNLQRQLKSVQHNLARKKVDFTKFQRDLVVQRNDMQQLLERKKIRERRERSRVASARNYHKKAEELARKKEEGYYIPSENTATIYEPEVEMETVIKTTRIRRKHRHFHHRVPKEQGFEEEEYENSSINPEINCSVIEPIENDASYVEMNDDDEKLRTNDQIIKENLEAENIAIGDDSSSQGIPHLITHDEFPRNEDEDQEINEQQDVGEEEINEEKEHQEEEEIIEDQSLNPSEEENVEEQPNTEEEQLNEEQTNNEEQPNNEEAENNEEQPNNEEAENNEEQPNTEEEAEPTNAENQEENPPAKPPLDDNDPEVINFDDTPVGVVERI